MIDAQRMVARRPTADAASRRTVIPPTEKVWPYRSGPVGSSRVEGHWPVTLTPYDDRAERGPSTMRVRIPVAD